MEDTQSRPSRHARYSAFGDGLFREREGRKLNWSQDWPFVDRRSARGPVETFERGPATPRRRRTDKPVS
jgi:hypothetical protein